MATNYSSMYYNPSSFTSQQSPSLFSSWNTWNKKTNFDGSIGGTGSMDYNNMSYDPSLDTSGSYLKSPDAVAQSYASPSSSWTDMFNSNNLGSTLGGIGSAMGAAGSLYSAWVQDNAAKQASALQRDYYNWQKDQAARSNARQDQAQANYNASFGRA